MDLSLLKYNESDAFLFKNTYTKEKIPFLFESDIFLLILLVELIF